MLLISYGTIVHLLQPGNQCWHVTSNSTPDGVWVSLVFPLCSFLFSRILFNIKNQSRILHSITYCVSLDSFHLRQLSVFFFFYDTEFGRILVNYAVECPSSGLCDVFLVVRLVLWVLRKNIIAIKGPFYSITSVAPSNNMSYHWWCQLDHFINIVFAKLLCCNGTPPSHILFLGSEVPVQPTLKEEGGDLNSQHW